MQTPLKPTESRLSLGAASFTCPQCQALAQQEWFAIHAEAKAAGNWVPPPRSIAATNAAREKIRIDDVAAFIAGGGLGTSSPRTSPVSGVHMSRCTACREYVVWVLRMPAWPRTSRAPAPSPDLPEEALGEYREAAAVVGASPRAAAALLRLCIEKLCRNLGKSGSIDNMIGELVRDGLSPRVQKALDVVRVIGNEAVHPGTMDLADDQETALSLFRFVNIIVERMITEEAAIDQAFSSLPEGKLQGIAARDKPKP